MKNVAPLTRREKCSPLSKDEKVVAPPFEGEIVAPLKIPGPPSPDVNSVASLTKYFLCARKVDRAESSTNLAVTPVSLARDVNFTSNGSQCAC